MLSSFGENWAQMAVFNQVGDKADDEWKHTLIPPKNVTLRPMSSSPCLKKLISQTADCSHWTFFFLKQTSEQIATKKKRNKYDYTCVDSIGLVIFSGCKEN